MFVEFNDGHKKIYLDVDDILSIEEYSHEQDVANFSKIIKRYGEEFIVLGKPDDVALYVNKFITPKNQLSPDTG